jgi:hypothetical protein
MQVFQSPKLRRFFKTLVYGISFVPTSVFAKPFNQSLGRFHAVLGAPNQSDWEKIYIEPEGVFSPGFRSYGAYFNYFSNGQFCFDDNNLQNMTHSLDANGVATLSCRVGGASLRLEIQPVEVKSLPHALVRISLVRQSVAESGWVSISIDSIGPAGDDTGIWSPGQDRHFLEHNGKTSLVIEDAPDYLNCRELNSASFDAAELSQNSKISKCNKGSPLTVLNSVGNKSHYETTVLFAIHPGRRSLPHDWRYIEPVGFEDFSQIATVDKTRLISQHHYRALIKSGLSNLAPSFGTRSLPVYRLPDAAWQSALEVIPHHLLMGFDHGIPEVSPVNYGFFVRDATYAHQVLLRSGRADFARQIIQAALAFPFSGRQYPEGDYPGQVLWMIGQQFVFEQDLKWVQKKLPAVEQIVKMIQYFRQPQIQPYVSFKDLSFGAAVPAQDRQYLNRIVVDGVHPEYTEAFDIAGVSAAASIANALGKSELKNEWQSFLSAITSEYFASQHHVKSYAAYSLMWPLQIPTSPKIGQEFLRFVAALSPSEFHYLAAARVHQLLLAGDPKPAREYLSKILQLDSMKHWALLDEGAGSYRGKWPTAKTTWNPSRAMPHSWSVAEVWALLHDCLVFQSEGGLILLQGIPDDWRSTNFSFKNISSPIGKLSFDYKSKTQKSFELSIESERPAKSLRIFLGSADFLLSKDSPGWVQEDKYVRFDNRENLRHVLLRLESNK